MLPIEPTPQLCGLYPTHKLITFNTPDGLPEEEVGSLVALCGNVVGGVFDGGPQIKTYWQPSPEEITALMAGGVIELAFFATNIPPISINVERIEEV